MRVGARNGGLDAALAALAGRLGRVGTALLTSLVWALPMSAWAGSVDLSGGTGPWVAFAIGAVLLVAWLGLLTRLARVPVEPRPHRFDIGRMGGAERGWNLGLAACLVGLVGWLNAAATVDWSLLGAALARGGAGPAAFTAALVALPLALAGGAILCWTRASARYAGRRRPGS